MSIKAKLFSIISILVCSILIIGGTSIFVIMTITQKNEELKTKMELQKIVKDVQYKLAGLSNDERGLFITGDQQYTSGMKEKADAIYANLERAEGLSETKEYKDGVAELSKSFTSYLEVNQKVVAEFDLNPDTAESLHFGQERTLRKDVLDPAVNKLVEDLYIDVEDLKAEIKKDEVTSEWVIGGVVIIATLLGTILSALLLRSILIPLKNLNQQLEDIAHGEADLTRELHIKSKDEFGKLATSFNSFLGSLASLVKHIADSSEQVAASSEQLSASSEQSKATSDQISQSMRTVIDHNDRQNVMMEKSSASIEEISDNIADMAINTNNIAEVSTYMSEKAKTGSSSMNIMSQQMNLIKGSVQKAGEGFASLKSSMKEISEISSLITTLSEQTNLLALNAAIEAARAGEQGKGFAVVAEEVRKLADESNKSANLIKGLVVSIQGEAKGTQESIQIVQENVQSGLLTAADTRHNLNEILDLVQQVTAQIQEVAASTQQMTASVEIIRGTTSTLNKGTKETTLVSKQVAITTDEQLGSMEEISHASIALANLAEGLQKEVNRFNF
ncbi:methyl-accepting chemotaxis protein [Rossellomorea marisflavi]|uniref:methyl-accepting chemotaxis protein n=1 Tax=Rossellomorea marisflavi TaxID=189381 RepID=UPI00064FEA54|nr:methyl-accepting chemotaxis protein [Rossellomorea marisflavi]KML32357.1 chemotaxis protein [Rossellomorea marisflavi]